MKIGSRWLNPIRFLSSVTEDQGTGESTHWKTYPEVITDTECVLLEWSAELEAWFWRCISYTIKNRIKHYGYHVTWLSRNMEQLSWTFTFIFRLQSSSNGKCLSIYHKQHDSPMPLKEIRSYLFLHKLTSNLWVVILSWKIDWQQLSRVSGKNIFLVQLLRHYHWNRHPPHHFWNVEQSIFIVFLAWMTRDERGSKCAWGRVT